MLEIGLANDAGLAVRGTERMRRRETVEAEYVAAATGQMKRRGAAHRAQADDDDVEFCCRHGRSVAASVES